MHKERKGRGGRRRWKASTTVKLHKNKDKGCREFIGSSSGHMQAGCRFDYVAVEDMVCERRRGIRIDGEEINGQEEQRGSIKIHVISA